ncbi:ribonuclease P protein component [Psittacicella gerlachiana]|uniref:Ribonuclease P protein component n=1 Tax=Psittacicella gerlachiana TaxID=2028574 RepID=A0A3A1Y7P9_9GAMM|nr:ribonuclease P protein component [Psittacicella gerlachiana]
MSKKNCFRYASKNFSILGVENNLEESRLGMIIAKKNIKLAHDRNRVRRIVREYFRLNQHKYLPVDILFFARSHITSIDNAQLFAELDKSFKTLHDFITKRKNK